MSYQLGIDLGTTYTAAAVCRGTEQRPAGAEVVTLGTRSATVASVLYVADDGSILVGEAAERRALTDPDRVVREFKRRIGDDVPIMLGGRSHQAHELAARLVRWVVDQVSEREGGPARRIAVTHPAAWGQHKRDQLTEALRTVGLSVTFLAEPQAAAVSYAGAERVEPGSTIAVYDLGGGTFDAAVVRKTTSGTGFELLGQPEGIERLGGVDFDEAVFQHVREGLGSAMDELDPDDKDVLSAVARLRRECVEAKEALSSDTEVTIPVLLPELRTHSRLVRAEFEVMIRPALEETVDALRRAVGSAGLTPADLTAVLLVGGSSRIPLVSQLVSEGLGRPVAVDADPKTAIALGAALAISPQPRPAAAPPPGAPRPGPRGAAGAGGLGAAALGAAGLGTAGARPGGPARPSAPRSAPPPTGPRGEPSRPAAAAFTARPVPPRPTMDYQGPAYAADPYAGSEPRRPTGMLIGIGGVVAIAAILAAVFLWPTASDADGTGVNSELTPSGAETTSTAPTASNNTGGSTRTNSPQRTPTRAPVVPKPTESSKPPVSTSVTPSSEPKPEPSTSNEPEPSTDTSSTAAPDEPDPDPSVPPSRSAAAGTGSDPGDGPGDGTANQPVSDQTRPAEPAAPGPNNPAPDPDNPNTPASAVPPNPAANPFGPANPF